VNEMILEAEAIDKPAQGELLPRPRGSGLRRCIFAWALHEFNGRYERVLAARKGKLLGGLTGTIVEIGPGTGANLRHYRKGVRWIGVEPNPYMHRYLREEAQRAGISAEILDGAADAIPCADESADAITSTLVLCSVPDVRAALREVLRVLKPGGQFVFIEHVAADSGSSLRRWQHRLRPWFRYFADGCNPERETWREIESAGFANAQIEYFEGPIPIVRPHISGIAVKKAA
jgi:ubiquinone/menaquinone biosynthesis C-methylase UbiE